MSSHIDLDNPTDEQRFIVELYEQACKERDVLRAEVTRLSSIKSDVAMEGLRLLLLETRRQHQDELDELALECNTLGKESDALRLEVERLRSTVSEQSAAFVRRAEDMQRIRAAVGSLPYDVLGPVAALCRVTAGGCFCGCHVSEIV